MTVSLLLLVAAAFSLAGFAKGVVGFGLPTISIGLLAMVMPPTQAAAIMLLPSFVTNIWQMLQGGALGELAKKLWPMLVGLCIGTWSGMGWMEGAAGRYGTSVLGVVVCLYALVTMASLKLAVPRRHERITSLVVGVITGLLNATTGVFVIPAVPYMQALGLEKTRLVQALGLFFVVSTAALAVNIAASGVVSAATMPLAPLALVAACIGMYFGQVARKRMPVETFRGAFLGSLFVLGVWLTFRPLFL
ncbi:sulfite exporter TauE/SafE family protein [Stappia indica]|uniref:sulfite exporter TauE/SafE family protein n=1 Tax=Stappia indica TaxID=538381 RepID=UPI000833A765|nr:sulfite exporter TauE/SafE family protein [Stappia indica]